MRACYLETIYEARKVKTDLAAPIGIMHSYENRGKARKTNPKTVTIWYHLQDAPTASSPKKRSGDLVYTYQ